MNIKYRITIISIIFFLSINLFSQETNTFGEVEEKIEYFFGFNLTSPGVGGLTHFALIRPLDDGRLRIIPITLDRFVVAAQGKQNSKANPKNINFFEKYKIENLLVINDLWRLRYMDYPFATLEQTGKGWSTNDSLPFLPTNTQMQILNEYGMKRMSDYIYGENAFKLLYNMTVDQWVIEYKESF